MSAARRATALASGGFTLLEVLMVVLLVGIISSVVVMSVNTGGAERALPEEAQRLAALLEQAANEAVMQNQEYGLRVTPQGYEFLCLDEAKRRWSACADEIFRERELAEGLELRILRAGSIRELPSMAAQRDLEASTAARERQAAEGDASTRVTPDLFLLSSGESSAASLEIRVSETPAARSEVSIDEVGRVSVDGKGGGAPTPVAVPGGDRAGPV